MMEVSASYIDMEKQLSQFQFEAITEAFNTITEWLAKDFPEVDFSVEFNDDSQNPTDPAFRVKTRLITDKTMDLHDQFLRKKEFVIRPAIWEDNLLMTKWINLLVPTFKRTVSHEINDWYARKKVEGTAI